MLALSLTVYYCYNTTYFIEISRSFFCALLRRSLPGTSCLYNRPLLQTKNGVDVSDGIAAILRRARGLCNMLVACDVHQTPLDHTRYIRTLALQIDPAMAADEMAVVSQTLQGLDATHKKGDCSRPKILHLRDSLSLPPLRARAVTNIFSKCDGIDDAVRIQRSLHWSEA